MIILIIAVLSAYLLGSIPISYLLAKSIKGIDIRKYGSGNIGATNVLRTLGKTPAIIALIGDILKGIVAVTILYNFCYRHIPNIDFETLRILLGLGAISGHIWTIFLKFKGGKGVATSAGVLLILSPQALGIAAIVWIVFISLTRYVSLSSIMASITLPITIAIMGKSLRMVIFAIILCVISTYKHKSNILRLINNEEPKIGEKIKTS